MGWFRIATTILDDPVWGRLESDLQVFVIKIMALRARNKPLATCDDADVAFYLRVPVDQIDGIRSRLITANVIEPGSWELTHSFRWFCGNGRPSSHDINAIRAKLYSRDGRQCHYCGRHQRRGMHVEHVIPVSRGGTNDMSNLVLACAECNSSKGAKTPGEWRQAIENGSGVSP